MKSQRLEYEKSQRDRALIPAENTAVKRQQPRIHGGHTLEFDFSMPVLKLFDLYDQPILIIICWQVWN